MTVLKQVNNVSAGLLLIDHLARQPQVISETHSLTGHELVDVSSACSKFKYPSYVRGGSQTNQSNN